MGVPKFFRWISERFPKINQRFGSPPNPETSERYFNQPPPVPVESPDPLSQCGLPPEVDRLYLDMNGIIHGCSHSNALDSASDDDGEGFDTVSSIRREEIFRNVCYYLDRIIGDMVEPNQLVYMAIDGVAPRAKLNQQRSRRYRSGTEGAIETSIYDAHAKAMEEEKEMRRLQEEGESQRSEPQSNFDMEGGYSFAFNGTGSDGQISRDGDTPRDGVEEASPGRFKGKFETQAQQAEDDLDREAFHSNVITPGTPFFQAFTQHLEHFVKYKLSTDPKWQKLTIIFSGPNVPGEGEHKIMQFIREQRQQPDYDPNLRHCITGQDGDLIMLGLATHEPNLVLLRERVLFNMGRQKLLEAHSGNSLDSYLHNAHFEFLHMGVLRDYLAFEFETSNVLSDSPWDLEHTIDDFVFMTFLVGNDFLPHMPALDIGDNAFDLLFYTYKQCRKDWLEQYSDDEDGSSSRPAAADLPYLTHAGSILSGQRLEDFLSAVGSHEVSYYDKKKLSANQESRRMRKGFKRMGMPTTHLPPAHLVASKEASDRAAYRKMLQKHTPGEEDELDTEFSPVMTGEFEPVEEELEEGLVSRMGSLLQDMLSDETGDGRMMKSQVDDQDLKGRYYHDKFQFSPFDAEKHVALRKAYMEGLTWTLKYYYEGCVSWEWYYPYHYGPMISDLVNLDEILDQVSFEGKMGAPLNPFEQLLGCMPPSQAHHLPEPYQALMTDPDSPIADFYPKTFTIDMNGKRWPWEAVALLPFIDSKRLLEAAGRVDNSMLTEEERERNSTGQAVVLRYDPMHSESIQAIGDTEGFQAVADSKAVSVPFEATEWQYTSNVKPVLEPELKPGVRVPLPGYASLRDAPVQSLWRRKLGIDVFGSRSRYRTSCLEMQTLMPPLPPIEDFAPKLIGTSVFVNYPYFIEALVTAVSDETTTIRGRNEPRKWTSQESDLWKVRRDGITRRFVTGEGNTGTGGLIIPDDQPITLSVRPFEKLTTMKDGTVVKSYAKFEEEVPLMSTFWNPSGPDPRLAIPSRLEKNAFEVAAPSVRRGGKSRKGSSSKLFKRGKLFPERIPSTEKTQAGNSSNGYGGGRRNFSTMASPDLAPLLASCHSRSSRQMGLTRDSGPIHGYREMGTKTNRNRVPTNAARSLGAGRGRMLSVGVVAAAFLFGSTAGLEAPQGRLGIQGLPVVPSLVRDAQQPTFLDLRGGEEEQETLLEDSSVPPLEFAHGTTTISFTFEGGIVAAVDSRASLGNFVGSKTVEKVLPVNSHILGTMAGGAADCQFWIRKLKSEAMLHEMTEGSRMSVQRASRTLSNYLYQNRGLDLSVGTMIMGYDECGPPKIFYVDNTGVRIEGDMFAVGSGGTFALGILDTERRHSMSEEEAIQLGIKAIRHATFRDAYSGGFINVFVITRDGWKKVFREDIARLSQEDNDLTQQI